MSDQRVLNIICKFFRLLFSNAHGTNENGGFILGDVRSLIVSNIYSHMAFIHGCRAV